MSGRGDAAGLARRRRALALAPARLRRGCSSSAFAFRTTADVAAASGTVVQDRALEALELGLSLRRPGYHVMVCGPSGSGRASAVTSLLAEIAATLPTPPDRAYVHRFDDPDRPRLLTMPPGTARELARAMDEVRAQLAERIPALLEDRELDRRREQISQRYAREAEESFSALSERLAADGLGLVQVQAGPGLLIPDVTPLRAGEPVPLDEVERTLPTEGRAKLRRRVAAAKADVREHFRELRDRHRAFQREARALHAEAATTLMESELHELREFAGDGVGAFLDEVSADAVQIVVALAEGRSVELERALERYAVNVVADRSGLAGAPVVNETYPTRHNLLGSVERVLAGPFSWAATASTIRAGSLARADGGFLIAEARDVLVEPGAWEALKRVVENGAIELGASVSGVLDLPRSLAPDPLPVDVKVVLIAEQPVHDLLYGVDPDVRRLFGVRASFSADVPRDADALGAYAAVVASICATEDLPHCGADALAALVEQGAVSAGRQDRLTARFSEIADILREASWWTVQRGARRVARRDVEEAVRRRRRRDGALEERIQELLRDGTLLVSTTGEALGQVNALSVYDLGYTSLGKPTRITASAAPGRAGIINVEREARLSGGVYDKGVLIISGFLRRRYAQAGPLSLTASLAFEQSYAGVDGDSASIAEVAALLSELSGLGADQRLAVTGSINQHGEVQPVGGVNDKIRGWHALCAGCPDEAGHGVVMPAANVGDLMLDRELVDDVRAGRFHVYAVRHVDEALELVLGASIAAIDAAVGERLRGYAEALRRAGDGDLPPVAHAAPTD